MKNRPHQPRHWGVPSKSKRKGSKEERAKSFFLNRKVRKRTLQCADDHFNIPQKPKTISREHLKH